MSKKSKNNGIKKLTILNFKTDKIRGTQHHRTCYWLVERIGYEAIGLYIEHNINLKKFIIKITINERKVHEKVEAFSLREALNQANIFYNKYTNYDK